jgi:hypothetical protein
VAVIQIQNDGRPNFAADPFNGRPLPTLEQAQSLFCSSNNNAAGCLRNSLNELVSSTPYSRELGSAWQNSLGVAQQIGETMAFEVDYVYTRGRDEKDIIDNVNLTYNPATGANYPFGTNTPFPDWGNISLLVRTGKSAYHGLQTSFTKRMSNRWQASATYTLSGLKDAESPPFQGDRATNSFVPVPFATAPDMGGEWAYSNADQRHRFVLNGIWEVYAGFQVSGLGYYGSGARDDSFYGGDLRNTGADFSQRLRPNGTIVPRNAFIQPDEKRVDVRLQQRIPLGGSRSIDLIADAINLFNANNFTLITEEGRSDYNEPVSGQFRTMQLGFRFSF